MKTKQYKLTYFKNKKVEKTLNKILYEASKLFSKSFSQEQTQALILIGGYGRCEGGIVSNNNVHKPHNNLDLLYIYNKSIDKNVYDEVNKKLQSIAKRYDIGIDISAISKDNLLSLKGLVISYDMRFGHVCILGNSDFLKTNEEFNLYNIDSADVRQLLVNRGTLLLINRLILDKENLSIKEKKLIIKHTIKAIIGYGDAFLYFHGKYNWSYAQKQLNMSNLTEASLELKNLYNEAILFRFKPNYEKYIDEDLKLWNENILQILSKIHLECENIYLNKKDFKWEEYFTLALQAKSYPLQNIKQKVKSSFYALKNLKALKGMVSLKNIYSFFQFGSKGMLCLLFPYIAYQNCPSTHYHVFRTLLGNKKDTNLAQLNGFLLMWANCVDTNFKNVLDTYDIKLEIS